MKVFIPTKKIEKYLRMCNFCSTFAPIFLNDRKKETGNDEEYP